MSARPQQTGRAAEVRKVLSMFPQGATIEQIKVAGRIKGSNQAIGYTLKGLARSGQAICHRSGVRGIWRLSGHTQHAIAPLRAAPPRVQPACAVGPLAGVSDAATTIRHREFDRKQLADDLDAFLAAGGHIEVLGHTPPLPFRSAGAEQASASHPLAGAFVNTDTQFKQARR